VGSVGSEGLANDPIVRGRDPAYAHHPFTLVSAHGRAGVADPREHEHRARAVRQRLRVVAGRIERLERAIGLSIDGGA
jgi:hypothetical protein